MRRFVCYMMFLCVILTGVSSCKKENEVPAADLGTWRLGTQDYAAKSVIRRIDWGGRTLTASAENAANNIVFSFKAFPTASGQYPIVEPADLSGSQNGVSISIYNAEGGSQSYYTSISGGTFADVTVANDKLRISIPLFVTEKTSDSTELLTATVSNIQEQ
jgi:hypothetical protein